MPPRFLVRGGRPLRGSIRPAGNKNAALPILASTVLADGPMELDNIPRIRDVETMLALLVDLGASVEWTGPNLVRVDTRQVRPKPLDPKLCARIRASILLAGPLLARFGSVTLPPPGGDVIGRRRVDTHFLALEHLGAAVNVGDRYELEAKKGLTGADIFLDEPSVTGTENALMAAVAAKGRTVLRNAACEPHVQDLARALVAMGAAIEGIGSNVYTIEGGRPLARRELRHRPRSHRDRQLHRPRRGHQRRDHDRPGAARRSPEHAARASSGSASGRGWTASDSRSTPTRSGGSGPISAATCRSSRTGPGRRSRPTSCPPPS